MKPIRLLSAAEQVADQLRKEIASGNLSGKMPGANQLAASLGVNAKTVVAALQQLEADGILVNQGPRRGRLISPHEVVEPQPMHIRILLYESSDRQSSLFVELQHALMEMGHNVSFAAKTLVELKMDVGRVEQLVKESEADAWVVVAGSQSILDWFSRQPVPAFALFGRRNHVSIASTGPRTDLAFIEAVEHLIAKGHQRIVKICRSERRKPNPGKTERAFLKILARRGISTGDYNLPDWEETPEGLQDLLNSLFRVTSPTALIVDEASLIPVVLQFLGAKRLRVPEDVSLFCLEFEPKFEWWVPSIAYIHWDTARAIRHLLKWSANVSRGKPDVEKTMIAAKFILGGTIGAVSSR